MRLTTAAMGVVLLAVLSPPLAAQTIRGHLLDLVTDRPLDGGVVKLISEDGDTVATSVTGADGAYLLIAPVPGRYYVQARRLGYGMWIDGPVDLEAGEEWDGEYRLREVATVLDPVEVTAPATAYDARLEQVGFYERQRSDFGHFMTREQIEQRKALRVSELLTGVPGVRLVPSSTGTSRQAVELRGSHQSYRGICHPRVFVDGIIAIRGDARPVDSEDMGMADAAFEARQEGLTSGELSLDDLVMPNEIEGIEIYRSSVQVPAKFGGTSIGAQCGVIVIWTRTGRG